MKVIEWVTSLGPRSRRLLAAASLLLLLTLIYPFKTITVPAWDLRVVEDGDSLVSGIKVTEHWQHFLLESGSHEETQITDQAGRASFPERSIRSSLLGKMFARLAKIGSGGNAARTDAAAAVVVWGSKEHATTAAAYQGKQPPQQIVVQRIR
jgi:hypothetical protein